MKIDRKSPKEKRGLLIAGTGWCCHGGAQVGWSGMGNIPKKLCQK